MNNFIMMRDSTTFVGIELECVLFIRLLIHILFYHNETFSITTCRPLIIGSPEV